MKIRFDDKAERVIIPDCFSGRTNDLKEYLGPMILKRAYRRGDRVLSWVNAAGRTVNVELMERWEEGELVTLVTLPMEAKSG